MRPVFVAALLLAPGVVAQAGRSVAVDALPLLREEGTRIAIEPLAWPHATLRLAFFGNGGDTDRLRTLSAEARFYPVTLRTRQGHRALPFVSAGVIGGQRDVTTSFCGTRAVPTYAGYEEACTTVQQRILRTGPTAAAGVRLVPGRAFLDVAGRAVWGDPGEVGGVLTRQWLLRAEMAVGYTW